MALVKPRTKNEYQAFIRLYDKPSLKYRVKLSAGLVSMLQEISKDLRNDSHVECIDALIDYDKGLICVTPGSAYNLMSDNCVVAYPFQNLDKGYYRFLERKIIPGEGKFPWIILSFDMSSVDVDDTPLGEDAEDYEGDI